MKTILIKCLRFYHRLSELLVAQRSPVLAFSGCRQWPTCSEYSIQAIERYGALGGSARALVRILRCNPITAPR